MRQKGLVLLPYSEFFKDSRVIVEIFDSHHRGCRNSFIARIHQSDDQINDLFIIEFYFGAVINLEEGTEHVIVGASGNPSFLY